MKKSEVEKIVNDNNLVKENENLKNKILELSSKLLEVNNKLSEIESIPSLLLPKEIDFIIYDEEKSELKIVKNGITHTMTNISISQYRNYYNVLIETNKYYPMVN